MLALLNIIKVKQMAESSNEHIYLPTRQKDRQRQIVYSGIKHIVNSN